MPTTPGSAITAAWAEAALDAVPLPTAVLDAAGAVVRVNAAWRQAGLPGVAGERYAQVCGTELAAGVEAVRAGKRAVFRLSHTARVGHTLRWLDTAVRRFEAEGHPALLVTHADTTDARRTEQALRQSEAHYRGVIEDQVELICRFTPDTTLTFVNEAYCRHFNKRRDELVGLSFLELIPPENWGSIRAALGKLTPERPTQSYAHEVVYADGRAGWQHWTDRALFDDRGHLVEFQSVGRDVTALKEAERAKHETDERFRELADHVAEVFWVFDWRTRRLDYVSPSFARVFGRSEREVLDDPTNWIDAVHPEDRGRVNATFRAADQGPYEDRYRVRRPDGSVRWVRDRGRPVHDADGNVSRIVGIAEDITAAVEAEERVRRSEDRYRAALDGSLDAFYLLEAVRDGSGTITDFTFADVNQRGAALISRSREKVVGQKLCELLPINRTGGFFDKYAEVVRSRQPIMDEFPIDAQDEGVRASWLQYQVVPVGDGVAITARDVSERKANEEAIARLYEQTQMILDAVPAFIFYKDAHNRILRVNRAAAVSIGLPPEQIEGRPTEDFFPEQAAAYYRDDVEVMNSGRPKLGYFEAYDVPGQGKRYIRTDKVPLYDEQGRATGVIAIATDITDQRRAELDRAVLEKAEEERRQIGHELHDGIGQQITGLRMLIEGCRRKASRGEPIDPATVEEVARIVGHANAEVRRLISGLTPDPIAAEELPAALRNIAGNLETFFEVKAVADCDEPPASLTDAQADHLLRIAQEAAHNAAKHAGATRVEIALRCKTDHLTLSVNDDGRGLNTDNDNDHSTGRGLRIMRHRADMIPGRLSMSSTPAGGTRVHVAVTLEADPDAGA